MLVKDVMKTRSLAWVRPDDDVALAVRVMQWAGVRHLPVLDQRRVAGVLTERDLLRSGGGLGCLERSDPVSQHMTSPAEVIGPEDDVAQASAVMLAKRIGCLPVVDERACLVGILTTTDLTGLPLLARAAALAGPALADPTVAEAMNRQPGSVTPETLLREAAWMMADRGVAQLPVVDGEGRLVGVLSHADLLRACYPRCDAAPA